MTAHDEFQSLMEKSRAFFTECLENPIAPTSVVDDTVATFATEYAVAALCLFFGLSLLCCRGCCCCCCGGASTANVSREDDDDDVEANETTPLTATRTRSPPMIQLTKRTPYQQILPLFFVCFGLFFGVGGWKHQRSTFYGNDDEEEQALVNNTVLLQIMLGLLGLSTSLLFGLGAMEYSFYVCSFRVIAAPFTYLWILLILGSMVAPIWWVEEPFYFAGYFVLVSILYLLVSTAQFGRRRPVVMLLFQVVALILNCVAVVTTLVLVQVCATDMGVVDDKAECSTLVPCPLPIGVWNPEAVFHSLMFVAMLFFGSAKLLQSRLEDTG